MGYLQLNSLYGTVYVVILPNPNIKENGFSALDWHCFSRGWTANDMFSNDATLGLLMPEHTTDSLI